MRESGLVTLDWLLVLAAIAGIAAVSVVAAQHVVDDETRLPADPATRLVEADVTAAFLADEATELIMAGVAGAYDRSVNRSYERRCNEIGADFEDVVASTNWVWEQNWTVDWLQGKDQNQNDLPVGTRRSPVRCELTPRNLLAGP